MKLKPSAHYITTNLFQGIGVFYLVYALVFAAIFLLLMPFVSVDSSSSVTVYSGSVYTAAVFLFVAGIVMFRENLQLLLQNGASRKTLFLALVIAGGIGALFMSVVDISITLVGDRALATRDITFGTSLLPFLPELSLQSIPQYLLYNLLELTGVFFGGLMIGAGFYRSSTPVRIIIPIVLVAGLFIGSWVDMQILNNAISLTVMRVIEWVNHSLFNYTLFMIPRNLLFLAGLWILTRRVTLRAKMS